MPFFLDQIEMRVSSAAIWVFGSGGGGGGAVLRPMLAQPAQASSASVSTPARNAAACRMFTCTISNRPAAPMPPPMHMVTTPIFALRRRPSSSRCARHARARHAIGMADGDRAAIHIELVVRNAELVGAIEHLAGEGLVQLPQIDVVDLQAVAFEQARHREHRADAHFVRLAAGRPQSRGRCPAA